MKSREVYLAVFDLVKQALPKIPAVLANQEAPVPVGDFCTILPLQARAVGQPELIHSNDPQGNLYETVSGHQAWLVSVNFFTFERGAALDNAERLRSYVQSSRATNSLNIRGLGFISATPVRDLSGIEAGRWECRAQLDLELSAVTTDTFTIEAIDKITIGTTLIPDDRAAPIEILLPFQPPT